MSQGFIAPGRAAAVVASHNKPLTRPLQIYAFDPSLGRRQGNFTRVSVPYEDLTPGPRGQLIEVIDYDASNDRYYRPVDLDAREILLQGGLPPTESDPRFHQQMVYAVVMKTIDTFGGALGRKVQWSRRRSGRSDDERARPLRVFPHAVQNANAYYDSRRHALLFGYFSASASDVGSNLRGQTVFSCLSHDIVAHETAHALVHHLRRFFMKPTSPDTLAFHEAFADIVALFQHFTFRDAVLEHVLRTGGALFRPALAPILPGGPSTAPPTLSTPASGRPTTIAEEAQKNVLVGLAQQFGEAMGLRASLRNALGTSPDPAALDRLFEVHDRGSILVAAVFDAFFTAYARRMSDLLRIARVGMGGELTVDLANRLASEAAKTARQFGNMCIRALDYCPPVDISFGDFLRALITADFDIVADDDLGYRDIIIESFRRRGIRPDEVRSYSESSLLWQPPDGRPLVCDGLSFDVIGRTDPEVLTANAVRLWEFADKNREALNLKPAKAGFPKVAVESFHPASRIGPDGQLRYQIIAELVQQEAIGGGPKGGGWDYWGGTTVILDAASGRVEYAIYKRLASENRRARQVEFRADWRGAARNAYTTALPEDVDFAAVHRGY